MEVYYQKIININSDNKFITMVYKYKIIKFKSVIFYICKKLGKNIILICKKTVSDLKVPEKVCKPAYKKKSCL